MSKLVRPDGRILALDFGRRRVGAAICDVERTLASPLEVYHRQNDLQDRKHYEQLIREERVERIVVGLPVHTTGGESELSREARSWAAWLNRSTARPVVLFDERFTSQDADEQLRSAGLKPRAHRDKRDMLAACILLQSYLDAGAA